MHIMANYARTLRKLGWAYVHANLGCKKLIHFRCCLGVQFRINILQSRADHVLPHVIKPEAIDRLSWTDEVPVNVEGTSYTLCRTQQGGNKDHLCSPALANKSSALRPEECGEGACQHQTFEVQAECSVCTVNNFASLLLCQSVG